MHFIAFDLALSAIRFQGSTQTAVTLEDFISYLPPAILGVETVDGTITITTD